MFKRIAIGWCVCFILCGMGAEAQKKDPVAMYGVIDTVQVVSQRVRHANEANAGAKVSRIDPEIMRANKTGVINGLHGYLYQKFGNGSLVNGIFPGSQSFTDPGELERD